MDAQKCASRPQSLPKRRLDANRLHYDLLANRVQALAYGPNRAANFQTESYERRHVQRRHLLGTNPRFYWIDWIFVNSKIWNLWRVHLIIIGTRVIRAGHRKFWQHKRVWLKIKSWWLCHECSLRLWATTFTFLLKLNIFYNKF